MCTVAFVPLDGGGYLLGHNRDERPARAAGEPPRLRAEARCPVLAPRDPEGGGTWIAVNDAGLTVCILNAAEGASERLPREPRSRGRVVADLACARTLDDVRRFLAGAPEILRRTRAFHVVAAEAAPAARVGRFRWDGVASGWEEGEAPALFVSSLLQPAEVERERGAAWRGRLAASRVEVGGLAAFLAAHEPARGPLSVCMHREDAGTVSRTIVEVTREAAVMRYQPGPPCAPLEPEVRSVLRLAGWAG